MTMDRDPLNHTGTWELLPWLVYGSIREADRQRVEEHLRACADCRDEHAFQQRLHAGMQDEPCDDRTARRALDRLLARIDEETDAPPRTRAPARRGGWLQRILIAALVLQTGAVAAVAMLWFTAGASLRIAVDDADYRTLSQPDASSTVATIRFVPAPDLSVGALQKLLAEEGLRVATSSEDGSILGLAPITGSATHGAPAAQDSARTAIAIAHLRAHPGVLLAEPITRRGDGP
jgi:hypothetical protein